MTYLQKKFHTADYYIPCLALPAEKENTPIGLWGQRHLHYLKEYKKAVYIELLTSDKLNNYLAEIDNHAQEMMIHLVTKMAKQEGINEQLKAENPMLWVGKMNEIQTRAREVVNTEIILCKKQRPDNFGKYQAAAKGCF